MLNRHTSSLALASSLAACPAVAALLRVDLNAEGRADMRTAGWENWQPAEDGMRRSFGEVSVMLRGGEGSSIEVAGNKALVVHGVTLGADGVVATGGEPPAIELNLAGLAPGPHTFVGYHHDLSGAAGCYTITAGERTVDSIEPSTNPRHNDEVGTLFIEFEVFEPIVETHTANAAFENVLADVGCNVPMLDDHDKRVIGETRTGATTYQGSKSGLPGLPDSQQDVGGWEDYPEIHRPADWDTDRAGLPNKWEAEKGLDPDAAAGGALDPDGDGYTNLEVYLNWLAAGEAQMSIP